MPNIFLTISSEGLNAFDSLEKAEQDIRDMAAIVQPFLKDEKLECLVSRGKAPGKHGERQIWQIVDTNSGVVVYEIEIACVEINFGVKNVQEQFNKIAEALGQ